ncbi:3'-5' exonuclease [Candidatus Pacearchaeota archaeon]|nr:3'-5' exonuclease [Candidatus Pacearchaeota archaeon]
MDSKILILDIETTGFSPKKNRIVELGIVSLDLLNGEIVTLFDECICEPGITKEEIEKSWIWQNSDITMLDIFDGEKWSECFTEVQGIINDHQIGATAFNNKFDFSFMDARGFIFPAKLRCPMELSTNICKLPKKNGNGYKWPTAEEAYRHFFPDRIYVEKHRGADDAKHEAEIVYELYKLGVF